MGLEFLARVRRTSILLGAVASLVLASYFGMARGLGMLAGLAWSLVNLLLLEKLVTGTTGEARGTVAGVRRTAVGLLGMPLLFVAGALLLQKLPALWLVIGFSVPLAVIVLKAATLLLLPSGFWTRVTKSPWRAAAVVGGLAIAAWAVTGSLTDALASKPAAHAAARHAATSPAGDAIAQHETTAPGGAVAEHGTAPSGHAEAAAHGEEEGPQKFANVITVISRAFPNAEWAHFLHHYEVVIFSLFIAALLCFLAFLATRKATLVPGKLQNVVEMLVSALHDFVVGILGPKHGPRYVPFLGTLFVYILAMNLFGLIPFMDSPTSSLNVTVSLALVVFLFAQFIGFKELGPVGWIDHMAGSPRTIIGWLLVPLMLPIHLMGELAKPISLSCRLFGNIFGEDMLLVAFASLGITMLSFTHLPFGVPLQLPFMFLALLTSTLQALVFTVLSTIYFLLMLPHEEHGGAHEEVEHAHSLT